MLASATAATLVGLVGPLGAGDPKVWAECMFADPIGDIAVLGSPDSQSLWNEAEDYENLIEPASVLSISDAPAECDAWLFGLDGRWGQCTVKHFGGPLWIEEATKGIYGGMSGSPILAEDGSAIGIVCLSGGATDEIQTGGGPNPRLMGNLPGWLLNRMTARKSLTCSER